MADMKDVITLHNIYRRNVLKEKEGPKHFIEALQYMKCGCCGETFFYNLRERRSVDRQTGGAYSRWCSQCASDDLGWSAEQIFMNARHGKNDQWLLTPDCLKGHAAHAACPDDDSLAIY